MCSVATTTALDLQGTSNFDLLLKEATEAYRMGDYNRALALCQPVSTAAAWDGLS